MSGMNSAAVPRCPATVRGGQPCTNYAGWGTAHFGTGRCARHFGLNINGKEHTVITPASIDVAFGDELATRHSGVRDVRLPEHPDLLNEVELVVSARHTVRDLLTTLVRARVDAPDTARRLLDDLMVTDAELCRVESVKGTYDPARHGGQPWELAWDRAASDKETAVLALLTFLAERSTHDLDAATLPFTLAGVRLLAVRLLAAAQEAEDRQLSRLRDRIFTVTAGDPA